MFLKPFQSDSLDKLICFCPALRFVDTAYFERHLYVMRDRSPGHQCIFLRQVPHFETRTGHRIILIVDLAGGHRQKPGNDVQESRFAAPTWSYNDDKAPLLDL